MAKPVCSICFPCIVVGPPLGLTCHLHKFLSGHSITGMQTSLLPRFIISGQVYLLLSLFSVLLILTCISSRCVASLRWFAVALSPHLASVIHGFQLSVLQVFVKHHAVMSQRLVCLTRSTVLPVPFQTRVWMVPESAFPRMHFVADRASLSLILPSRLFVILAAVTILIFSLVPSISSPIQRVSVPGVAWCLLVSAPAAVSVAGLALRIPFACRMVFDF